jgi:hypothetical protein
MLSRDRSALEFDLGRAGQVRRDHQRGSRKQNTNCRWCFRGRTIGAAWPSMPVARLPRKECVGRDHRDDNEHPVLTLKTQKGEWLNEELHGVRPFLRQNI